VARVPQLGSKPVDLLLKLDRSEKAEERTSIAKLTQELYRSGELTDLALVCAGHRLLAHRAVLAARSRAFRDYLAQLSPVAALNPEIILSEVTNSEAAKIMLDHLYHIDEKDYWDRRMQDMPCSSRTQELIREVLLLANRFELPHLTHRAMIWLSKGLTTDNVVERLSICNEFDLAELADKILEQLIMNREALGKVAHSAQIMTQPKIMQAMLQCVAVPRDPDQPRSKRPRGA